MRARTTAILFIGAILVALIVGVFAGWRIAASGAGLIGLIGALIFGRKLPVDTGATDAADKAGDDARAEASGDAESMDRVVERGRSLVEESERLIRETGQSEAQADRKP